MRGRFGICPILNAILLLICLAGLPAGNSWADEDSRYLDAVREFADNVLKYGKDNYGPKHTPSVPLVWPNVQAETSSSVHKGLIYRNPRVYNVEYSFELFPDPNKIDRSKDLKLWVPIPREWDSQKAVKIISVQPEPHAKYVDPEYGNPMLFWDFGKEPEKPSYKVNIKYRVEQYEVYTDVDPNRIGPYDKTNKEYILYTQSTHSISITDKVKELAKTAIRDETNPYLQVKRIYEFVTKTMRYNAGGWSKRRERGSSSVKTILKFPVIDQKTAEECYEGDCFDYSTFFVALCRAVGIPARTIMALQGWCPWRKPEDAGPVTKFPDLSPNGLSSVVERGGFGGHGWAEIYLPNYGWIPVDPAYGRFAHSWSNKVVVVSKGRDIKIGPNAPRKQSEGYGNGYVLLHEGRTDWLAAAVWSIAKVRRARVGNFAYPDPFPAHAFAEYAENLYPETEAEENLALYRKRALRWIDQNTRDYTDKIAALAQAYKKEPKARYEHEAFICYMLRKVVGDKKFSDIVETYTNLRVKSGEPVSTARFQKIAEDIYGKPLDWFFKQWVGYTELPQLQLDGVTFSEDEKAWHVRGNLRQLNNSLFCLPVELVLETETTTEHKTLWLENKNTEFEFSTTNRPKGVLVDPNNDILRIRKMPPPLLEYSSKKPGSLNLAARAVLAANALTSPIIPNQQAPAFAQEVKRVESSQVQVDILRYPNGEPIQLAAANSGVMSDASNDIRNPAVVYQMAKERESDGGLASINVQKAGSVEQKKEARILIDRSRDWMTTEFFTHDLLPTHKITDNRSRLSWEALKKYDVLILINSSSLFHYTKEELRAIKRFVEGGGGLLIECNGSAMVMAAGKLFYQLERQRLFPKELWAKRYGHISLEDMPINQVLGIFGIKIVNQRCNEERLFIHSHPAISIPQDVVVPELLNQGCFKLLTPEGAEVLIEEKGSGAVVGMAGGFGRGRIIALGFSFYPRAAESAARQAMRAWRQCMVNWLSVGHLSVRSGVSDIPQVIEMKSDEEIKDNLKIRYNEFTKNKVPIIRQYTKAVSADFKEFLGLYPPLSLTIRPSGFGAGGAPRELHISYTSSLPWMIHYIGHEMAHALLMSSQAWHFRPPRWFNEGGTSNYLAIRALGVAGFEKEAEELYKMRMRRIINDERSGLKIDLTKDRNAYHPKATWVLDFLERTYGPGLLRKFCQVVPANALSYFPYVEPTDILIYYLSKTAGEDLFPFFAAIGTTVNPLPIIPEDTPEFKKGIADILSAKLKDKTIGESARISIAGELMRLAHNKEGIQFLANLMKDESIKLSARIDAARGLLAKPNHKYKQAALFLSKIIRDEAIGIYRRTYAAIGYQDQTRGIKSLRELGLIPDVDWMVCGPFQQSYSNKNHLPEEEMISEGIDLQATYRGKRGEVGWFPVKDNQADHLIIFNRMKEFVDAWDVAYAVTILSSPEKKDAQLRVSSDSDLKIWLNGKVVPVDNKDRDWEGFGGDTQAEGGLLSYQLGIVDQETIPIHLKEGRNELLIKISTSDTSWEWQFNCRMTDTEGRPFDNIRPIIIEADERKKITSPTSVVSSKRKVAFQKDRECKTLQPVDVVALLSNFMNNESIPLSSREVAGCILMQLNVAEGKNFLVQLLDSSTIEIEERLLIASALGYAGVERGLKELMRLSEDEALEEVIREKAKKEIETIKGKEREVKVEDRLRVVTAEREFLEMVLRPCTKGKSVKSTSKKKPGSLNLAASTL